MWVFTKNKIKVTDNTNRIRKSTPKFFGPKKLANQKLERWGECAA